MFTDIPTKNDTLVAFFFLLQWKGLAIGVGAGERHHLLILPKCRMDCSALVFVMLFCYFFVLNCFCSNIKMTTTWA